MGTPYIPQFFPAPDLSGMIIEQQEIAHDMVTDTIKLAKEIQTHVKTLEPISLPIAQMPTGGDIDFNRGPVPESPEGLDALFPATPTLTGLTAVGLDDMPAAPEDDIDVPGVDFDAKPTALTAVAPSEPPVGEVPIPVSPDLVLPDLPSLASVTVPDVPYLDLPVFNGQLGDTPIAPDVSFEFNEEVYTSELLTRMRDALQAWVDGDYTGLEIAVEQALWDRGRDRETATYSDTAREVLDAMASRGYPVPPGAASMMIAKAQQLQREKVSTFNRDVTIEQAKLEQSNRHFAISSAWNIEGGLIQYTSQIAGRSLDASKFVIEAALEVYKAQVLQYNADVEAFKARAAVYRDLIQAELAKLEVYKTQLEGQRLLLGINQQQVDIYRARIESVRSLVSIFEAQVNAARVIAEVERLKIDGFKARVDAYDSTVRAKASEYEAYATQVRAEVAKLEPAKIKSDVLRARTDAYAARIRGMTDFKKLEVEVKQQIPLEKYKAEVSAFEATMRGIAAQVDAIAKVYASDVDAYEADVRGESARVSATAQVFAANAEAAGTVNKINSENAQAKVRLAIEQVRIAVEAARSVAQIASTMAAGALSSVSLQGSIGVRNSVDQSYSGGMRFGYNINDNYSSKGPAKASIF